RAERQQWKHAYFLGDSGHLQNRSTMKRLVELFGVQEQKMRAERELERTVSKRQRWQFAADVPAGEPAGRIVIEKGPHRGQSQLPQFGDRANRTPDELGFVQAGLFKDVIVGREDPVRDRGRLEVVQGIARNDRMSMTRAFSVKACGAAATI